jgi:hypothetical protein
MKVRSFSFVGRAYVLSLSFALFLGMISVTFLTPIPKHPFWWKICFLFLCKQSVGINFKFSLYSISSHNSLSFLCFSNFNSSLFSSLSIFVFEIPIFSIVCLILFSFRCCYFSFTAKSPKIDSNMVFADSNNSQNRRRLLFMNLRKNLYNFASLKQSSYINMT